MIFLDDILVYSKDLEAHMTHVRQDITDTVAKISYMPKYLNVHSFNLRWSTWVTLSVQRDSQWILPR